MPRKLGPNFPRSAALSRAHSLSETTSEHENASRSLVEVVAAKLNHREDQKDSDILSVSDSNTSFGLHVRQRHLFTQTLRTLILADHIHLDKFIVWTMAYLYIPIMAVILGISVNCALHELHTVFFPRLLHTEPFSWKNIVEVWIPHSVFCASLMVVGYSFTVVVSDALIDSVIATKCRKLYELKVPFCTLFMNIQFIVESGVRISIFVSSLFFINYGLYWYIFPTFKSYKGSVWQLVVVIYIMLLAYVSCLCHSIIKSSQKLTEKAKLWGRAICRARNSIYWVITVYALFLIYDEGFSIGSAAWIEANMYLISLHLSVFAATSFTKVLYEVSEDVRGLILASADKRMVVALSSCPWMLISVYSTQSSWGIGGFILLFPGVHIFTGITRFVLTQKDMTPSIFVKALWIYAASTLTYHSIHRKQRNSVKEKSTFLKGTSGKWSECVITWLDLDYYHEMNLHHWVHRMRFLLRSICLWLTILTLCLGIGVVIQGKAGYKKEHIVSARYVDSNDESRIVVQAQTLHAYMEGTSTKIDDTEVRGAPRHPDAYASMCNRRFNGELHLGDLAYFSFLSYFEYNLADFHVLLRFYKRYRQGVSDWEVVHIHNAKLSSGTQLVFYEFHSSKLNASIISIRGTDPSAMSDLLQNVSMYQESFIFGLLSLFLPGSSIIPEHVIVNLVHLASRVEDFVREVFGGGGNTGTVNPEIERHYWRHVFTHAQKVQERTNLIALTGHSLGGAIAGIVGARLKVQAIGFSAPGLLYVRKKFGIHRRDIDAYVTNVITSNDLVPLIDKQGGTIYNLLCENSRGDICHAIELHVFRAWTLCNGMRESMLIRGNVNILPQIHETLFYYLSGRPWGKKKKT